MRIGGNLLITCSRNKTGVVQSHKKFSLILDVLSLISIFFSCCPGTCNYDVAQSSSHLDFEKDQREASPSQPNSVGY